MSRHAKYEVHEVTERITNEFRLGMADLDAVEAKIRVALASLEKLR